MRYRYPEKENYNRIAREFLKQNGFVLTKNQEVHHINGDHSDNRLENLRLLTKSEHMKLHWAERRKK